MDLNPPSYAEALDAFAEDFKGRMTAWEWWTDALFVRGTSPIPERRLFRSDSRVYLIGPDDGEGPPVFAWATAQLRGAVWRSLLVPGDAVDWRLEAQVASMRPVMSEHEPENFFALHVSRRGGAAAHLDFGSIHHEDLLSAGAAKTVDSVPWVADAVARVPLRTPKLP